MASGRIKRALSRARYASIGAAIGAFAGGLFSRNGASSGAAMGALVGAAFGESRLSARERIDEVKERGTGTVSRLRSSSD